MQKDILNQVMVIICLVFLQLLFNTTLQFIFCNINKQVEDSYTKIINLKSIH